jgi:hypothetical protein
LHNTGKENRGSGTATSKQQHQQQQQQQQQQQPPAASQAQQQQQQQPGYVACPICSMSVRQAFINSHIDTCLEKAGDVAAVAAPPPHSASNPRQQQHQNGRQQHQTQQSGRPPAVPSVRGGSSGSNGGGLGGSNTTAAGAGGAFGQMRKGRKGSPLEAPPKLCFELLKEKELKGKLTALGLSNDGNKKVGVALCPVGLVSYRPLQGVLHCPVQPCAFHDDPSC